MDTHRPADTAAVVALKAQDVAKSRLRSLPDDLRRELASAMALDTLRALRTEVDSVLVVGKLPDAQLEWDPRPEIGEVDDPPTPGLNAALRHGAAILRNRGFAVVLACVGDLPALRPESVRRVLEAAEPFARSFLADATGTGTTMLIAHDVDLNPHFGRQSARAHLASGAQALEPPHLRAVPDARTDVDAEVDLAAAARLGVGPATASVVERFGRLPESDRSGRSA